MKTISTTQRLICGIVLLGASLLMSCGTSRKVAELPQTKTVEILAVNDMHAAIDNFPDLLLWLTACEPSIPIYCSFRVATTKQETPQTINILKKECPLLN